MFCSKCGKEISDGYAFCANCGAKIEYSNMASSEHKENQKASVNLHLNKIKPKYIIAAALALIVLIVVIVVSNFISKTVDLNEFVTVSFTGYDTKGKAVFTFDKEAFEEKYGDKIKVNSSEINAFYYEWFSPAELFLECIDYDFDKDKELKNGDTIVLTWDVKKDVMKKTFGLNVKASEKTFSVSGLQEINFFDPFEGIELEFEGISPNGEVSISNYPDNGLYYSLDKKYDLTNGDIITLSISYGWNSEDSYLEQYGKLPNSETKTYTVSGLKEYVTSYADISQENIVELQSLAYDLIVSHASKDYNTLNSLNDIEYVGYAFLGPKSGYSYWSVNNALYIIYRGIVSNAGDKFDPTYIYFPVKFTNFIKNDKDVSYNKCEGIEGTTKVANTNYNSRGYANPYGAFEDIIINNKNDYITEYGDGFELYEESTYLTSLSEIDENFLNDLQNNSINKILDSISQYRSEIHVGELNFIGYYLVMEKQPNNNSFNNALYLIFATHMTADKGSVKEADVYYPVKYDGIMKLPDKWIYRANSGIIGRSKLGNVTYNCYTDSNVMYEEIISSSKNRYAYEISEGLKKFGE